MEREEPEERAASSAALSPSSSRGWGGSRRGSGRIQQHITLTLAAAQRLRRIVRRWHERDGADWTPARVVEVLIVREADAS